MTETTLGTCVTNAHTEFGSRFTALPLVRPPLTERELELDAWVRQVHLRLALAGLATYGVELVAGIAVAVLDSHRAENEILRVFLGFRLLSYAVLVYGTADLLGDYEPAHPAP